MLKMDKYEEASLPRSFVNDIVSYVVREYSWSRMITAAFKYNGYVYGIVIKDRNTYTIVREKY